VTVFLVVVLSFLCEDTSLFARHVGDAHLEHAEPLPCAVDHLVVLLLGIVRRVFDGELAGGLYGVLIGKVFCGESMFTRESNAGKSAFMLFVKAFERCGGVLIDSQVYTENIARYGGRNISRTAFLRMESELLPQKLSGDLHKVFAEIALMKP